MGRISKFENYVLQDEREGKVVPQKQELKKKKKARVGFYSQKKGCSQAIKKKKRSPLIYDRSMASWAWESAFC